MINHAKFPDGYGQKSREWVAKQVPRVMDWVERMEQDIPEKSWIKVSANDHVSYFRLMREARVDLTKQGFYHPKMMRLLKRLRCLQVPNSFECSLKDE
ncbi:MAG: putative solute-binding protein [Pseudomonadota bacterium]|nr:putative solute-binding protein [Pseudomonadota bacterium]